MTRQYVTVTQEHKDRAEKMLRGIEGAAPKALARAINRAVEGARSEGVRKVRDEYTARARDIRDTIRISRAKPNRPQAVISSIGPALSLSAFKYSPASVNGRRRTPIRVAVKRGERDALERSFVARVGGGKKAIYERVGKSRLPIRKLTGPSVPQMIGNPLVIDSMADRAREVMDQRLDHEIDNILKRGR